MKDKRQLRKKALKYDRVYGCNYQFALIFIQMLTTRDMKLIGQQKLMH